MFEQSKDSLKSSSVVEMLDRLEGRVERGSIKKNEAEKSISVVAEGIAKAKKIVDQDFDNMTPEQIADLSNAWKAFGKDGILKGEQNKELRVKLQKLWNENGINPSLDRFARQVWRTEMVDYLIDKLAASSRPNQGEIVEKVMAAQIVSEKEDDPIEALTGAMNLDKAIYGKAVRVELAGRMDKSDKSGGVSNLPNLFPELVDDMSRLSIKIVVGGALMEIPLEMTNALVFKKMVVKDGRIYGQMKNGCRGNLVVIDVVKTGAGTPPVRVGDGGVVVTDVPSKPVTTVPSVNVTDQPVTTVPSVNVTDQPVTTVPRQVTDKFVITVTPPPLAVTNQPVTTVPQQEVVDKPVTTVPKQVTDKFVITVTPPKLVVPPTQTVTDTVTPISERMNEEKSEEFLTDEFNKFIFGGGSEPKFTYDSVPEAHRDTPFSYADNGDLVFKKDLNSNEIVYTSVVVEDTVKKLTDSYDRPKIVQHFNEDWVVAMKPAQDLQDTVMPPEGAEMSLEKAEEYFRGLEYEDGQYELGESEGDWDKLVSLGIVVKTGNDEYRVNPVFDGRCVKKDNSFYAIHPAYKYVDGAAVYNPEATDEQIDYGNLTINVSSFEQLKTVPAGFHRRITGFSTDAPGITQEQFDSVDWTKFVSMEDISISYSSLRDLDVLKGLPKLKYINGYGLELNDFNSLGNLKNLEMISLSNNPYLSDVNFASNLVNLKILHLSNATVADISALRGLPNLEELNIGTTLVKDISVLKDLSGLKKLYIDDEVCIENISSVKALIEKGVDVRTLHDYEYLSVIASMIDAGGYRTRTPESEFKDEPFQIEDGKLIFKEGGMRWYNEQIELPESIYNSQIEIVRKSLNDWWKFVHNETTTTAVSVPVVAPVEAPETSSVRLNEVAARIISETVDLVPETGDENEPFYLYPFSTGIGFAEKGGPDNPVYNLTTDKEMRAVAEQLRDELNRRWAEVKKVERVKLQEVYPNLKLAIESLNSAHTQIKTVLYPNLEADVKAKAATQPLPPDYYDKKNGLGLVEDLLERPFDPQDYLPIMMKESRLIPDVELGFFQIDGGAQAEMKKYYNYTIEGADLKDPVKNSVAGILYYDRCLNRYAQDKRYGDLKEDDTRLLSYALYNKGPTNLRRVWDIVKPAAEGGYMAFEKALSDAICAQLGAASGDAKTVADTSYTVNYLEYPGVAAYLEVYQDPARQALLSNNLIINGQDSGMTVYQVAVMLRYARLVDALREQSDFEGASVRVLQDVPDDQLIYARVFATPEKGLWSYSNELRRLAITEFGIDAFTADDEPASYLQRDAERQNIIRMIVDFNNERNPAVIARGGISDADVIAADVEIWLPNSVYMKAWLDYSQEAIVKNDEYLRKADVDVSKKAKEELQKRNVPEVPSSSEVMLTPNTDLSSDMVDRLAARTLGYAVFQGNVSSKDGWSISYDSEMEKQGLQIPDYNGDYEAFLSGATFPADGKFEAGKVYLPLSGKVIDKDSDRKKTQYIVIHSTNSTAEDRGVEPTVKKGRAHFVIGRDGIIHKPRDIEDNFDHVGKMKNKRAKGKWNGDSDVSSTALGIEVAAKPGEAFTPEQYAALKSLVEALGEKYQIPKKNVLCHSQVGCITYKGRVQRFSKPDPANFDWSRIGFPNNYNLIDYDVLNGNMDANFINVIGSGKSSDFVGTTDAMFVGVKASQLLGKDSALSSKRSDRLTLDVASKRIEIVDYTVKKGDNLTTIAKRYGTDVSVIMDYNKMKSADLSVGQRIKVPKNYK